ncbi:MAG: Lrp/AsnC ligand binding domain-containing protein [Euryarchaeota archaeon]|nr:Lrp/AsnC ligand binding domain-containing protein [Euryarchaeota archaeon]
MQEAKGEGILFLKVKPGTVETALREVRAKAEVTEADPVLGPYDLVIAGAFKDLEDFRRFSEGIVKTDFCEDCVESISLERWRREKPARGAAAAWTLIKAENPKRVAEELRKVPAVNAVFSTMGSYNVVAKLVAKNPRELQDAILRNVHALPGLRRTESLTMAGEED